MSIVENMAPKSKDEYSKDASELSIIRLLTEDISNIENMKDLDLPYNKELFDKIFILCYGKYRVTDNSPIFIRKNFRLVREALINSTIGIDFIITSEMTPEEKCELVNICLVKGIDRKLFKELYEQVIYSIGGWMGQDLYISHNSELEKLPLDIKEIYISDYYLEDDFKYVLEKIKKYQQNNPNLKIIISRSSNTIYGIERLKQMTGNVYIEIPSETHTRFSVAEAIEIEQFLDLMVMDINNSNMSCYEKYQAVYHIATNLKKYQYYQYTLENDRQNRALSRDLYSILSSEWIVCSGYVNLLRQLLKRVGIPCESWGVEGRKEGGHLRMYVNIVDKKYGIDGYYMADPTWDAVTYVNSYETANYKVTHTNMTTDESHNTDLDQFDFLGDPNCLNDKLFCDLSLEMIIKKKKEYLFMLEYLDPLFFKAISEISDEQELAKAIYAHINQKLNNPIPIQTTIAAYENIERINNKESSKLNSRLLHNEYVVRIVDKDKIPYLIGYNEDIALLSNRFGDLWSEKIDNLYPYYSKFLYQSLKQTIEETIKSPYFYPEIDINEKLLKIFPIISYQPGGYAGYNSWSQFNNQLEKAISDKYKITEYGSFSISIDIPLPDEIFELSVSKATELLSQIVNDCLSNFYSPTNVK